MGEFVLFNGAAKGVASDLSKIDHVWVGIGFAVQIIIRGFLIICLICLLAIIMKNSSADKFESIKIHFPLIMFFSLTIRTTIYYPEILLFMFIFTLYFLLRPSAFTMLEEICVSLVFGTVLAFSSKLNADPLFF